MEHVTDHAERALSRMAQEFRGIPELDALVRMFCRQIQDLEDAAWGLYLARNIDAAEGALLEFFGRVVGERRQGALDPAFRRRIRARILVNRSSGTAGQLLEVFRALLPSPYTLNLTEYFPASEILAVAGAGLNVAGEFSSILHEAKAAGVRVALRYQPELDATTFTLGTTGLETITGLGLGDTTNPAAGGSLAGVIA